MPCTRVEGLFFNFEAWESLGADQKYADCKYDCVIHSLPEYGGVFVLPKACTAIAS